MATEDTPFWKRKSLEQMTKSEWESICDGCGKCCLVKLEDADDSARTYFTEVGCRLLDGQTCGCRNYANRSAEVHDCVRLTPRNVKKIVWLPPTYGYRLLARIPRLPRDVAERIAACFCGLQKLLAAGVEELQQISGVSPAYARMAREGLSRLAESAILDRFG